MPKQSKVSSLERRNWLERYEKGMRLDGLAKEARRDPRTITTHIEKARLERDFEAAQRDQLREALQAHQDDLLGQLVRIRGLVGLPQLDLMPMKGLDFGLEDLADSDDLAQQLNVGLGPYLQMEAYISEVNPAFGASQPTASEQAITVVRDRSGPKEVRLAEEGSRLWRALKEHLGARNQLWRSLADWQQSLLDELQARAGLDRIIRKTAEGIYKCPVLLSSPPQEPRLTTALIRFARVEVTRRLAIGEPATNYASRLVQKGNSLEDQVTNSILADNLQDTGMAVDQFISVVDAMTGVAEAQEAARRHEVLQERIVKAHDSLDDYLLLHHVPGRCSLCKKLGGE